PARRVALHLTDQRLRRLRPLDAEVDDRVLWIDRIEQQRELVRVDCERSARHSMPVGHGRHLTRRPELASSSLPCIATKACLERGHRWRTSCCSPCVPGTKSGAFGQSKSELTDSFECV